MEPCFDAMYTPSIQSSRVSPEWESVPQVTWRSARPLDMLTVLSMLETESGTPTFELHRFKPNAGLAMLNVSEVSKG